MEASSLLFVINSISALPYSHFSRTVASLDCVVMANEQRCRIGPRMF